MEKPLRGYAARGRCSSYPNVSHPIGLLAICSAFFYLYSLLLFLVAVSICARCLYLCSLYTGAIDIYTPTPPPLHIYPPPPPPTTHTTRTGDTQAIYIPLPLSLCAPPHS